MKTRPWTCADCSRSCTWPCWASTWLEKLDACCYTKISLQAGMRDYKPANRRTSSARIAKHQCRDYAAVHEQPDVEAVIHSVQAQMALRACDPTQTSSCMQPPLRLQEPHCQQQGPHHLGPDRPCWRREGLTGFQALLVSELHPHRLLCLSVAALLPHCRSSSWTYFLKGSQASPTCLKVGPYEAAQLSGRGTWLDLP